MIQVATKANLMALIDLTNESKPPAEGGSA